MSPAYNRNLYHLLIYKIISSIERIYTIANYKFHRYKIYLFDLIFLQINIKIKNILSSVNRLILR